MRFSVLLPTRNGERLLEGCMRSVLSHDYEDMELVVSDNASDEPTRQVIASFDGDPRLKALRVDEPVEVTDNWLRAYDASSGDYVLIVGDDDYLLPGYFDQLHELIDRYRKPDCLTYNGYAFAFPGSLAGQEAAHYADPFARWDERLPAEGELARPALMQVLRDMFRFQFRIHLNLQTTLVSRAAVERLPVAFLKPPFPDFYALGALMMKAERWVYAPVKPIVIGISPKSFGHTIHDESDQKGLGYLGISTQFDGQLPGNEVINGHVLTLQELKSDFPRELEGVDVDRSEYLAQQLYFWYLRWRLGQLSGRRLARLLRMLRGTDAAPLARAMARRLSPGMLRRNVDMDTGDPVRYLWPGLEPVPEVHDIAEFARWISSGQPAGPGGAPAPPAPPAAGGGPGPGAASA
jgi:Glycosyl transferase family 2